MPTSQLDLVKLSALFLFTTSYIDFEEGGDWIDMRLDMLISLNHFRININKLINRKND